MLTAIILALLWVRETRPVARAQSLRLDVPGAFLLGLGILFLLFPVVEINEFHNGWPFLLLIPSAAFIAGFLRRESLLTSIDGSPLLDLRLFRVPTFTTGVAFALVFFCSNNGIPLLLSLFYQQGLGFSALESGLGVSAIALGIVVSSTVAGRLAQRIGRPLVITGVSLFFVLTIVVAVVVHFSTGVTNPLDVVLRLVVPLFCVGLGAGSVIAPNQTLALAEVDPRNGGAAGGVLQTAQRAGSTTGQTVLGTVFFLSVAEFTSSQHLGRPAADHAAFSNALDAGLAASLVFSASALVLGLVDLRRKRGRAVRGAQLAD